MRKYLQVFNVGIQNTLAYLRIPMNSDTHSDPYRTVIPIQFGHFSERSDAVVGFIVGKTVSVKVGRLALEALYRAFRRGPSRLSLGA